MPTPLVANRPRMKRVRHRSEPERYGGGVELARGRGSDRRVLVKWDDGTQRFHDRAEILPEGRTMKVSKQQLRRMIRETLIREAEFYGETPEGQLTDTEAEDAVFTQQLDAEKVMKAAGLSSQEISQMWPFIKGTSDPWGFMETPMFEKLFDWFAFESPADDRMPYGTAKARTGVPDEWIIDRLALGKEQTADPLSGRNPQWPEGYAAK